MADPRVSALRLPQVSLIMPNNTAWQPATWFWAMDRPTCPVHGLITHQNVSTPKSVGMLRITRLDKSICTGAIDFVRGNSPRLIKVGSERAIPESTPLLTGCEPRGPLIETVGGYD